jgi:hypothetical protein
VRDAQPLIPKVVAARCGQGHALLKISVLRMELKMGLHTPSSGVNCTVGLPNIGIYTRVRLEIPTAICGRTEETSITDSRLWKIQMLVSIGRLWRWLRPGAAEQGE